MASTRSKRSARPKAASTRAGKGRPAAKSAAAKKPAKSVARPAAKPARAARPVAKAPVKPARAVQPARPAKPARPAMPKAAPGARVPAKAAPAKGAKAPANAAPAKGAKAPAKAAKPAPVKPVKKVAPPPVVKPLGVLPPESRARVVERAIALPPRPRPAAPTPSRPTTPQGVQRVTERDMKLFEERLLSERQKLLKDMGHLENTVLKVNQRDSSGDLSGYSFHMADAGTDAMEREKAFMFASAEGRALLEIDEALRRLYAGEYGVCERCGNPIARARLEAMPNARLCVSCKEKEEKESRGLGAQGPGTGNP